MKIISEQRVYEGQHIQITHDSRVNNCEMTFAIYLPPQSQLSNASTPALLWLSGLTCNHENFMQKAGALAKAAELGWAIICPDTSPRGVDVADEEDAWDMGKGAGFYVNATQLPWKTHYQMYDYLIKELIPSVHQQFSNTRVCAISGHSMGGHGALTIGLKHPELFRSISAFSPITNPVNCAWGQKAFSGYLGDDKSTWLNYDACELLKQNPADIPILIDQGSDDSFLQEQLKPENIIKTAISVDYPLQLDMHTGYDHSYYFVSTFINKHLEFHNSYIG